MKKEYAEYLLKKTQRDYNLLAEDYARTREYIPQDLKDLIEYSFAGEKILDAGCADGRLYPLFKRKQIDYFGIDISEKLIGIAKRKYLHPPKFFKEKLGRTRAKFQIANALNLPFPGKFFDKAYSISVLHNIPSYDFQLQYLKEIKRVLKPEGLLILRVWDLWKRKQGWKLFLEYSFLKLFRRHPPTVPFELDFFDVFIPWKDSRGEFLVQRYFHCFRKCEFEKLIKKAGFKIQESYRLGKDPRTNIYIIAKKH